MKAVVALIAAIAILVAVSIYLPRVANPGEYERQKVEREAEKVGDGKVEETPHKSTLMTGRVVTLKTDGGTIKFVLFEHDMPNTSKNFVDLANKGFYNGLTFHRVEDWVVQGGDPKGDGTGGSDKMIKLETSLNVGFGGKYMVGMARSEDPDSASSQFFFNTAPAPWLTGQYACFAIVFEGTEVIDKIKQGDKMESVTVAVPTKEESEAILEALKRMPEGKDPSMPVPPMPEKPSEGND